MQTASQAPAQVTVLPPPATRSGQSTAPAPVAVVIDGTPVPRTKEELRALLSRKSELSDQLQSVQGRRNSLARQLQSQSGISRSGIENRLVVLDQRLLQLERDIQSNSNLIAQSPLSLQGTIEPPGRRNMDPDAMVPIAVVFTLFVLAPIAFTLARNMWRRGNHPSAPPPSPVSDARLERVEQSMDAIAIEIERITEGQRFITQLLSKPQSAPALGVGQAPAEPVRVPNAAAAPIMVDHARR